MTRNRTACPNKTVKTGFSLMQDNTVDSRIRTETPAAGGDPT